jgi:hypothetical protein
MQANAPLPAYRPNAYRGLETGYSYLQAQHYNKCERFQDQSGTEDTEMSIAFAHI